MSTLRSLGDPEMKVMAVGTQRGRAVVWLIDKNMKEYVVPTSAVMMSILAEAGVRIRNES